MEEKGERKAERRWGLIHIEASRVVAFSPGSRHNLLRNFSNTDAQDPPPEMLRVRLAWGPAWTSLRVFKSPQRFLRAARTGRGLGLSPTQTSAWGVSGGERREEGRKRHREGQRGNEKTVHFLRFNGSFWGAKEIGFLCAPWR